MTALLAGSAALAAPPVAWVPQAQTSCNIEGWSEDSDPRGLNVRAAPSAHAAVVGTLPPYEEKVYDVRTTPSVRADLLGVLTPKEAMIEAKRLESGSGVEGYSERTSQFLIKGSADGWLRIDGGNEYRVRDVPDEWPVRPTYAGPGWISGRYVRFAVQSGRGYVKPDAASAMIVDLKGDWLTEMGTIDRVVACSGEWVLLDFHLRHQRIGYELIDLDAREQAASHGRAWFRRVCPIIETTCDGIGDEPLEPPSQRAPAAAAGTASSAASATSRPPD